MTAVPPVAAIVTQPAVAAQQTLQGTATMPSSDNFASLLSGGLKSMEAKVAHADAMVKAFALDDSIPVHQVTYALEEARLSVELAIQVRNRLLDGFRELMTMQL